MLGRARTTSLSAELVEDRGAAAASEEFFRSRPFLDAEGATHTLLIEGRGGAPRRVAVPVIVRGIPGSDQRDAVSPYGYPGATASGPAPDPAGVDWAATGLVSVFIRERVQGDPCLARPTERSVVQVADPALPPKSRMSDRQQIRRNERDGYEVRSTPGPKASEAEREAFESVYSQTMQRTGAAPRYRFPSTYFESLLRSDRARLFLVGAPGGAAAAAAIAVESDGLIHYYLSGTADAHLDAAPSKNLIAAVIQHAAELGMPMNLGGGVRPGDGLEMFKRGFANRELPFRTHEIVCSPEAYAELSAGRADSGFFPLYRAG